jgi:hypothetical protein
MSPAATIVDVYEREKDWDLVSYANKTVLILALNHYNSPLIMPKYLAKRMRQTIEGGTGYGGNFSVHVTIHPTTWCANGGKGILLHRIHERSCQR